MEYVGYPSHSYYTPLDLWGKANFISITSRTIFDAANVYLLFRIVTFIQIFGHSSAHGVAGNTYRVRLENVENSSVVPVLTDFVIAARVITSQLYHITLTYSMHLSIWLRV